MQQQPTQPDNTNEPGDAPVHKIAENPNPRANENIIATPFEENKTGGEGTDVGTEITDGEAG
jgi:hypothetical protein